MKLANISLSALALVLAASAAPAFSADLSVQAELIGSQSKLDLSGKTTIKEKTTGAEAEFEREDKAKDVSAPGFGVNLQYKLNDALRLGGGLSYIDYDGDDDQTGYTDTALSANASYDFFKQDAFAIYGMGGLSYHMVATQDLGNDLFKLKGDDVNLLNYDLGIGGRFEVAQNVNIGLAYRFSDTLSKGELESTAAVAGLDVGSLKTKDVSLQKNDFVASVGYSF